MFTIVCICHFEYENLKSLVTHNHLPQEYDYPPLLVYLTNFNNSTQRLAAAASFNLSHCQINQFSSIYLALLLGSPSFLNLGHKTGLVDSGEYWMRAFRVKIYAAGHACFSVLSSIRNFWRQMSFLFPMRILRTGYLNSARCTNTFQDRKNKGPEFVTFDVPSIQLFNKGLLELLCIYTVYTCHLDLEQVIGTETVSIVVR